jgi:hypothetical protein
MSTAQIYLFKAARRPLYRKENLHLLAEQRGAVVDLAYNRSWVAPDYFEAGAIARGAGVIFIFTDRPYHRFVPVRAGEVVSATWDDLMLRVRVALGNWVGLDSPDLETFTQIVKQTGGDSVPGRKFVSPRRDHLELVPFYDEREDEGWRRAVDEVLKMSAASEDDPYRESVFFRSVGLRTTDGELHRARRLSMEPGTDAKLLLHFHNPHLHEADTADLNLRAEAPESELTVVAPERFPLQGEVEIDLQLIGGHPELTVQIAPASALHTHVVERFRTPVLASAVPTPDEGHRRDELLGVYDFVARNAQLDAGDRADLFERFAQLLPDEQRIREDWALWRLAEGDGEDAYRRLRDLEPEMLTEKARFALFRLALDWDLEGNVRHLINSLNLTSEGSFERLLDELETMEPAQLARFVPELAEDLPVEQLRDLDVRVARRLTSPDAIGRMADAIFLAGNDARWACEYLQERLHTLRLADSAVEGRLIDLARGLPTGDIIGLDRMAARRINNRIESGRLDEAIGDLRAAAAALPADDRESLFRRVVDRLLATEQHERAVGLLIELAWSSCDSGNLESATGAIVQATGIWAHHSAEPPSTVLEEAKQRIQTAWEQCAEITQWRQTADERRRTILREKLSGTRILVAGGFRNEFAVRLLSDMTGAEVEWAARYRNEGDDLDAFAERISGGRYSLVLYLYQKSGHEVAGKLKGVSQQAGVPFLYAASAGAEGSCRGCGGISPLIAPVSRQVERVSRQFSLPALGRDHNPLGTTSTRGSRAAQNTAHSRSLPGRAGGECPWMPRR